MADLFHAEEVRKAIALLIKPGNVFEIRALKARLSNQYRTGIVSGYFDNIDKAVEALSNITKAQSIYITLNPLLPDLLARRCNRLDYAGEDELTKDKDITRRHWLLMDFDPKRPRGISSTEAEATLAQVRANEVEKFLAEVGFPKPVKAKSGNGAHLLYKIDLDADDNGLVEHVLKSLSVKFPDDAVIFDKSVYNPARITKLYGTVACKGDWTEARPHRYSKIDFTPDPLEIVSRELLEKVAALLPPATTTSTVTTSTVIGKTVNAVGRNGGFDVREFLSQHGVAVKSETVKGAMTVIALEQCPFDTDHGGHGEVTVFENVDGRLGFKCQHASCASKHWREFRQHFEPGCYSGVPKSSKVDQYGSQTVITTGPVDEAKVKANEQASYANAVDLSAEKLAATNDAIILPGNGVTITGTAETLFQRIAPTQTLFQRGGVVVELRDENGELNLDIVRPAAARSRLERYGSFFAWRAGRGGEPVLKPTYLQEDMARALLESEPACKHLLPIEGVVNCPLILAAECAEHKNGTTIIGRGYNTGARLLITDGKQPPEVETTEAVASLKEILIEFDFQTPGDRSRALASFMTPALKLGGHLRGNVPIDIAEGDKSQSGKTYRQRIVAAIYNEKNVIVSSRSGGVGSVDESFNAKLIAGHPFIQLDNFRGKFDSPHIEAFLTAERRFSARVPHSREVDIDPSRFFIQMSSNGAETTRDFANRASIIRIRKREGFVFRKYEEGDLLAHVRAKQSYYLGCVFSIVKAWVASGCQHTNETRHDFREWSTALDWIIRNIFNEVGLMDGHQAAQERVSNPGLTFLRKLALLVAEEGRLGEKLIASQIYEIADQAELTIPGLKEADEDKGKRVIGGIMSRLFKDGNNLEIDGFTVLREETQTKREDGRGGFTSKTYCFARVQSDLSHASKASNASNTVNVQENCTDFLEVIPLAGVTGGLAVAEPASITATQPNDGWEQLGTMTKPSICPPAAEQAVAIAAHFKNDPTFGGLFED